MTLHFLNDVVNDANSTKIENYAIIASLKSETMGTLIHRIPGSRLLISSLPGSDLRTLGRPRDVNKRSQSLAWLHGKLDIKRHSPSILYLLDYQTLLLCNVISITDITFPLLFQDAPVCTSYSSVCHMAYNITQIGMSQVLHSYSQICRCPEDLTCHTNWFDKKHSIVRAFKNAGKFVFCLFHVRIHVGNKGFGLPSWKTTRGYRFP